MNPGPATSTLATPSTAAISSAICCASSRGFVPKRLGQLHRDVRRPVAVVAVARTLEHDVGCGELERLARTSFLGDRCEDGEEGCGERFRVHSLPSLRRVTRRNLRRASRSVIYSHAMKAAAARRRLRAAGLAIAVLLAARRGRPRRVAPVGSAAVLGARRCGRRPVKTRPSAIAPAPLILPEHPTRARVRRLLDLRLGGDRSDSRLRLRARRPDRRRDDRERRPRQRLPQARARRPRLRRAHRRSRPGARARPDHHPGLDQRPGAGRARATARPSPPRGMRWPRSTRRRRSSSWVRRRTSCRSAPRPRASTPISPSSPRRAAGGTSPPSRWTGSPSRTISPSSTSTSGSKHPSTDGHRYLAEKLAAALGELRGAPVTEAGGSETTPEQ